MFYAAAEGPRVVGHHGQGVDGAPVHNHQPVDNFDFVFAVPKTVVNEEVSFEGAQPEPLFLEQIMKAVAEEG